MAGFRTAAGARAAPPKRAFLLAAIARPERFERDAAAAGVAVVGRAFFRDHHRFSLRELASVAQQARRGGADVIVTTAKDAVRLETVSPFADLPLIVLEVEARVTDEPRFRERLLAAARRAA